MVSINVYIFELVKKYDKLAKCSVFVLVGCQGFWETNKCHHLFFKGKAFLDYCEKQRDVCTIKF